MPAAEKEHFGQEAIGPDADSLHTEVTIFNGNVLWLLYTG
jgi:hypothetical protein